MKDIETQIENLLWMLDLTELYTLEDLKTQNTGDYFIALGELIKQLKQTENL